MKKPVKYERLESWVYDHDARIVQAGSYPAQVVFILEEDLKAFCKAMGLPHMGPLSGGRCYKLDGDDFSAVVLCFKLDSGQLISTIAHECYHALNFIYKQYGVRHSLGNDEPTAYLIGHMAYYATKFIEEQGYALINTGAIGTDATDSGDLRTELSGPQQGRVDGSAEPATGAGGTLPRESTYPTAVVPRGGAGGCAGHDGGLTHTCPTCGEEIPNPPAYHVCTRPRGAAMKQCDRCGVQYFTTHKHSCNKHDITAWEAKHEQDS